MMDEPSPVAAPAPAVEPVAVEPAPIIKRRGGDVIAVEEVTAWKLLRRYLVTGSWIGMAVFVLYGIFAGVSYGGFGGIQFFTDMFLLDYLGRLSALAGVIMGIFIGVVCVWAICVIFGAAIGALVYYIKYKSFPAPQER
jgi:hypothetical protein